MYSKIVFKIKLLKMIFLIVLMIYLLNIKNKKRLLIYVINKLINKNYQCFNLIVIEINII